MSALVVSSYTAAGYTSPYENPVYLDAMDKLRRAEVELPGYKGSYATDLLKTGDSSLSFPKE